jgi:ribosomal protein L37AE/L43A
MDDDVRARFLLEELKDTPTICNFCHIKQDPNLLYPEETGAWVCEKCIKQWEAGRD